MSIDSKTFYQSQSLKFENELNILGKKLDVSSAIRLLVAIATLLGIYLAWGALGFVIPLFLLGAGTFAYLVVRHDRIKYQQHLTQELLARNQKELRVLQREFSELPDGKEFQGSNHWYSKDIDLFGSGSFYQYLNRTALESGSKELARLLLSNNLEDIDLKQAAIAELAAKPEWRQEYGATATLVRTQIPAHKIIQWLSSYVPFVPNRMINGAYVFSAISLAIITACSIGWISWIWTLAVFVMGMVISGKFVKKVSKLSVHVSEIQNTFTQYSRLLALLEDQKFESQLLVQRHKEIKNETNSSSGVLKRFSNLLDRLDQRNNLLVGFILNGFFLRDLIICGYIEAWINQNKHVVPKWFDVIAFFDAYNSLGNYAFNHPGHVYPTLLDEGKTLECKAIVHPLLAPDKAVPNDIAISLEDFYIITGANMAGKSTFLRTIALHLVMANVGLPVCAESSNYRPIKLITSMRTTDSLKDDESYFFSELKRLKFIIEEMESGKYFIVLDEILKGTNSKDKAIGSQKFIDKLVCIKGTGIVATHDLSLCEVAQKRENVSNYFFDAQIVDGELTFDYQFKKGICQNMNASFLLKKMGIVE
ncbi:MutS-related protein [Flagellimonas algicola]|uniref:DNA mismatch repair protein MutS n=1 Tax=Flagellimonas algicola TaxID=2583815 RepID=A0ABY2WK37_9FLAO|nr:DNA mismatch repair protein MutS [Allomuricauda algicola]TMU54916.1 DNA mismatch repair protein MutS [Allomuricauda algicola]